MGKKDFSRFSDGHFFAFAAAFEKCVIKAKVKWHTRRN